MTQAEALNILKTGANVFLTGEPGAGKTHTVNAYIRYLRMHGVNPSVTASTGIAATHVGGMTIHSWSGIGIRRALSEYDLDSLAAHEPLVKRMIPARVLVIDEISMLDARVLDMVDQSLRAVRKQDEPFGGLQVVFVGDFFQLPPIATKGDVAQFAFESAAWKSAQPVVCYLEEQFRQEDSAFLSTLTAIRRGDLDDSVFEFLSERRLEEETFPAGIPHLYTHNVDVDKKNTEELERIEGDAMSYQMQSRGTASRIEQLMKGCLSPQALRLKVGAQVMFTKNNFDAGYVNGTLGEVVRFEEHTQHPVVETHDGEELTVAPVDWSLDDGGKILATITQLPLRLAWAITIHKSQGMSLDAALMDLSRAFEYGQGYVALSRVRSSSGLHLIGINQRACEVHPLVLEQDARMREYSHAARAAFNKLAASQLGEMHKNFLRSIGGKEKAVAISEKHSSGKKLSTHEKTLLLVLEKKSIKDIAALRSISTGTVFEHLESMLEKKTLSVEQLAYLCDATLAKNLPKIRKTFIASNGRKLTPVHEQLKGSHTFDTLRLARIFLDDTTA